MNEKHKDHTVGGSTLAFQVAHVSWDAAERPHHSSLPNTKEAPWLGPRALVLKVSYRGEPTCSLLQPGVLL